MWKCEDNICRLFLIKVLYWKISESKLNFIIIVYVRFYGEEKFEFVFVVDIVI